MTKLCPWTVLCCLLMLLTAAVQAVESRLPTASWLTPTDAAQRQAVHYLLTLPSTRTLFDRLNSGDNAEWRNHFTHQLQALPSQQSDQLGGFRKLLIAEGFDPQSILSSKRTARSNPRLKHAVCVRITPENARPSAVTPLLLTVSLNAADVDSAASLFSIALALQSFRLQPLEPIWFCATDSSASADPDLGLRELLSVPYFRKVALNPYRFKAHLDVGGHSAHGFVNFMGEQRITVKLTENRLRWSGSRQTDYALLAAQQVRRHIDQMPTAWAADKRSPYARLSTSPIVCDSSLLSNLRPSCYFQARLSSRSRTALADMSEQVAAQSQAALAQFNETTARKAFPEEFSQAVVRVDFPKNVTRNAFALENSRSLAVQAWSSALTAGPGVPGQFISTRFVHSAAALSAQAGISALRVSGGIEPHQDSPKADLQTLALTALLLSGLKTEEFTIPSLMHSH